MEQFPSPESAEISKDQIIAELKKGIDTPGVREVLIAWTDQLEKKLTSPEAAVRVEMLRYEVYLRSNCLDDVVADALEWALTVADQEGLLELAWNLEATIKAGDDTGL